MADCADRATSCPTNFLSLSLLRRSLRLRFPHPRKLQCLTTMSQVRSDSQTTMGNEDTANKRRNELRVNFLEQIFFDLDLNIDNIAAQTESILNQHPFLIFTTYRRLPRIRTLSCRLPEHPSLQQTHQEKEPSSGIKSLPSWKDIDNDHTSTRPWIFLRTHARLHRLRRNIALTIHTCTRLHGHVPPVLTVDSQSTRWLWCQHRRRSHDGAA